MKTNSQISKELQSLRSKVIRLEADLKDLRFRFKRSLKLRGITRALFEEAKQLHGTAVEHDEPELLGLPVAAGAFSSAPTLISTPRIGSIRRINPGTGFWVALGGLVLTTVLFGTLVLNGTLAETYGSLFHQPIDLAHVGTEIISRCR